MNNIFKNIKLQSKRYNLMDEISMSNIGCEIPFFRLAASNDDGTIEGHAVKSKVKIQQLLLAPIANEYKLVSIV